MSFRRSLFKLAERTDIHPALKKLWKKHYDVNGEITQHLSPFEQKIVEVNYFLFSIFILASPVLLYLFFTFLYSLCIQMLIPRLLKSYPNSY